MKDFQAYQQIDIRLSSSAEIIKAQLRQLSYDHIKSMLDLLVQKTADQMKSALWFEGVKPDEDFLKADLLRFNLQQDPLVSSLFTYFIQKKVVPSDSKIAMIGDLHGDIDVLLATFGRFFESRLIDENFNIIDDRFHVVFLGDYVNRRHDSLSVLYLLSLLAINNPDRVVLMRGNHEYASTSKYFHERFLQGRGEGTYLGQETLMGELYKKNPDYVYPDLLYWFDYLPMALYIGSIDESSGVTHLINACHGGLEIGVDYAPFLADKQSSFMRIVTMNRAGYLADLRVNPTTKKIGEPLDTILNGTQDEPSSHNFVQSYKQQQPINFFSFQSPFHLRLGEQWNNFLTEDLDDQLEVGVSLDRRTIYLGKNWTSLLLKKRSSETVCVHGVVRGHQHLDEEIPEQNLKAPMLTLIRRHNGVVRQWGGKVYTLGASDEITGWHSFIMLTTAHHYKDWSVQHLFKRPDSDCFSIRMYQAFSE